MRYNSLFKSLDSKLGSKINVRRYTLSDMISESYKALYGCDPESNMYKLVEAHLADVRKNPKDTDRLSRQLSMIKEIAKLNESGELKDEDLVSKEDYDTVEPKKSRALDLKESAAPYTWGDWQTERGSSCRVRYYASGMDLTNQIIGIVYEETKEKPYYGAEIYDNTSASTVEERADDSYHFDTEKEAMEWVEEWFRANESVHDEDVEETEDEDLLEDTDLTDEEVEELTKHLAEIRKNKKVAECDSPIKAKPRRSQKVSESVEGARSWDADWITIPGESCRVKYYFDHSKSDRDQIIGTIYEPNGREFDTYGADIYNNKTEDFLSGTGIDIEDFVSEIAAKKWVESWFSKNMNECDAPKTPVKETTKPRKLKRARESAPVWSRYHIVNPEGETIDSYTDRKDAEDWVNQLYKDGDYKKGDLKVVDSQAKNESKSYESLNLSDFGKKSSSKAFVKTFKKLQDKLKEGTALTRQESISLYKAANSAMTHLSVELEHNPEFLSTFKESVSLLSADVNKILDSLKEGKAPSKKTMKSLAKFSESLLKEDEEEEDLPPIEDEENEFISDEEGSIDSEEEEDFDQEYADARVELHKELADDHADSEDPGVQEKLAQDAEEVVNLPGITDEQRAEIESENIDTEEEPSEENQETDESTKEMDDSEITDDELAELKRHLVEMRKSKKSK